MLLVAMMAQAQQVKIGGNVYGGGNAGNMTGSTNVTVYAGELNDVYGGARMADVGGRTFVHIDGEHASDEIFIQNVYGGNDISGTIGESGNATDIPTKIEEATQSGVDNTWKAFVRTSASPQITETIGEVSVTGDSKMLVVGTLFGGGNGDYVYKEKSGETEVDIQDGEGNYIVRDAAGTVVAKSKSPFSAPELSKTYLEIKGGCIAHVYGGGNNATVTAATTININNSSSGLSTTAGIFAIKNSLASRDAVIDYLKEKVSMPDTQSDLSSFNYNHARVFGGNNKAEMSIMPKWNLQKGIVRDLYSGGNEGHMTSKDGLLVDIKEGSTIIVDNLFGGCRKADVHPMNNGVEQDHVYSPAGYSFPIDLAARVIVKGGDVNNVYGGNDISGKVHFGSAVGINTSIRGNVYGGGNGYYAYTDNPKLKNDPGWRDFYYNPNEILSLGYTGTDDAIYASITADNSVKALNKFRPNAEQVSIHITGTEGNPTIIGGSVFVGGNCATLKPKEGYEDPMAELKIGSYVIADKVFLGNNGEKMVDASAGGILEKYAGSVTVKNASNVDESVKFSKMDLTVSSTFAEYMEGVTMEIEPSVRFDDFERDNYPDYVDYSSSIGSFYCGGNVGSMRSKNSVSNITFDHKVIIFDKLVGGCNSANVPVQYVGNDPTKTQLNAAYQGGLIGDPDTDGNRLILNLSGLKIQPKRWAVQRDPDTYEKILTNGKVTYLTTTGDHPHRYLEWNTVDNSVYDTTTKTFKEVPPVTVGEYTEETAIGSNSADINRRLFGGNVYGGCYDSGIVNGNVVINIKSTIVDREDDDPSDGKDYGVFDSVIGDSEGEAILYASNDYKITKRRTGVILDEQGMDVFGHALNVFGGGHGKDTEIWGSTTINLTRGYTFQIFGGSEEGVIGKLTGTSEATNGTYTNDGTYTFNGKTLKYDPKYSCYINVMGKNAGVSKQKDHSEDMAEAEFIYGGGFFGPIAGNTVVNMGKGRVFNAFAGSCNADILGHTETYVGRMPKEDYLNIFPNTVKDVDEGTIAESAVYVEGFPWIRDYVYGGNDLGGKILGNKDFIGRVSDFAKTKMYTPSVPTGSTAPVLTKANAYVEYLQGRADGLFGGCYGTYDYTDPKFKEYFYTGKKNATTGEWEYSPDATASNLGDPKPGNSKPHINNAFVNFRPAYIQTNNVVKTVFGAGQGQSGEKERDILQNRSYVLIDIPDDINDMSYYKGLEVFGAGAWGGVGMKFTPSEAKANPDSASAIIDLMRGTISAAYGGSFKEGITRRTVVNVPKLSTINITNIFGGAYGFMETKKVGENTVQVAHNEVPCDVYEANVNFSSENAFVTGAIYGGNNACRRTVFGKVNINSTVHSNPDNLSFQGNVYGAGYGKYSWSHYTEVNLNKNAVVYYVYGGGNAGKVLNKKSLEIRGAQVTLDTELEEGDYKDLLVASNDNPMIAPAKYDGDYYNTNVHLKEGATITGYGFGGGHGAEAVVTGTAYLDILGGTAEKDVSGSGRSGDVKNLYEKKGSETFTAKTMVYVEGGTARNVYASGWRGSVGRHNGDIDVIKTGSDESLTDYTTYNDVDGEANVVIGKVNGTSYLDGIPAITRNVYGGGEGGSVFGTTNVTINKGYIGYRYNPDLTDNTATTGFDERYVEELVDGDQSLENGGNVFGGGYVANSYVDNAVINMYGGQVRGSIYGGGEIGPVGRGTARAKGESETDPTGTFNNATARIYKGGSTHVYLYGGHVMRNIFGGGRGQDNWGGDGTKLMSTYMTAEEIAALDLSSKGFVFGSTDVHIRGGEVGTAENALHGYGNVFGGGDEGFVYSATGTKASDTYYKNAGKLTLDCNVVVEPYCQVKPDESVEFDEYEKEDDGSFKLAAADATLPGLPVKSGEKVTFNEGKYVPTEYLLQLKNKTADDEKWGKLNVDGVTIHNAVFAGGNIATGSDIVKAETPTVYGNAAASLRDIFNRDLISVGTDEIGGLYGDGNLTLVDGFRELHIDNYGTDFYNLSEKVDKTIYDQMTQREKDYYQLKYVAKGTHTYEYYVSSSLHTDDGTGIAYKKGQKVTAATYSGFSSTEKANWNPGTKTYSKDDEIEDTEWALMDPIEQTNWKQDGIFSKYAGRPLNTIQRADMCGVYGSRMVLNGAQDRASEEVDYNDYTINRVGEVSLNQRRTLAVTFPSESTFEGLSDIAKNEYLHGNYFGIYNTVKFLGNLTSDVRFTDKRVTNVNENTQAPKADGKSYYDFKLGRPTDKYRNNGTSFNKVALASGVYLEIKREETEKTGTDVWGYITGIVELDLINVMQGMGGGYVYAKNEHGTKTTGSNPLILLNYNADVASYREFNYTESDLQLIETSGNFIHNTKQIVDDCYPNTGMYSDGYVASPAHYWYIRGQIYVYDQYISAYTGVANAYAEKVELPLTISAASNGRMTLREVQPNYYAYYDKNGMKLGDYEEKLTVNGKTYKLNDPISYWDYRLLSDADKEKFVEETYTTIAACTINGISYPAGYTMQPGPASQAGTYEYIKASAPKGKLKDTDTKEVKYVLDEDNNKVAFDFVFRKSNNISHDQGYILTYEVNNPEVWNSYYTKSADRTDKINTKEFTDGKRIVIVNDEEVEQTLNTSDYYKGPTFSLKSGVAGGIFGQREYKAGEIVNKTVKNNYDTNVWPTLSESEKSGQAQVEEAYIVTSQVSVMSGDKEVQRLYPGAVVSPHSQYIDVDDNNTLKTYTSDQWNDIKAHLDQYVDEEDGLTKPRQARVCTSLLKFSTSDYVYTGQPLSTADIDELVSKIKAQNTGMTDAEALAELNKYMSDAYLCYQGGDYGGQNFAQGQAYRALDTWSALSEKDRKSFTFNYDAFDLFVDSTYSYRSEENYGKQKVQYDGYKLGTTTTNATTGAITGTPLFEGDTSLNPAIYSVTKPVDYQAVFVGYKESDETTTMVTSFSYTDENLVSHPISVPSDINDQSKWLSREEYEDIPNERHHYSPIEVKEPRTYYVVKKAFMRGDVPYTVGQVIDVSTWTSLNDQQKLNIDQLDFTAEGLTDSTPTPVVDKDGKPVLDSQGNQVYEYDPFYYYYCREPYTINEKGEGKPVKALMANANGRDSDGETVAISKDAVIESGEVPAGFVIRQGASNGTDQYTYNSLVNKQKGFVIHGTAPTETSTLYVSSGSDIYNLQKEKIITVIYLYEYEESDEGGNNVTPVSERHIVNIHINFESGVPEVGELRKPDIVYPGTSLTLDVPSVSEGAYRVTDSGWELFYQESDANTHTNGIPYTNGVTPVYWYQNNYWVAYYAQTYLGKTYSNSVQVSVANAHDLKSVVNHPQHYYIDHKDVDYEPKIYINDYSSSGGNGLDMLKSLYDLSLLGKDDVTTDANGLIDKIKENGEATTTDSPFKGQALLDERVKAGQGLEFFLHTDLDGSTASEAEPTKNALIAGSTDGTTYEPCFSGRLHGEGHYISGLTKSLFGNLCGSVYNLGVMGTFTGAGIAETGDGYVENCWISTSSTADKTTQPVFGNPNRTSGQLVQVVNSYYKENYNDAYVKVEGVDVPKPGSYTKQIADHNNSDHGTSIRKDAQAFYNGEVAYDLNGFYLFKRYADGSGQSTGLENKFYTYEDVTDPLKTTSTEPRTAHYGTPDAALSSSGVSSDLYYPSNGYVEDRFADGDFRYSDCKTIPLGDNPRAFKYMDGAVEKTAWYPVWPDDYIFFGQNLSYGHVEGRTHQEVPSSIVRTDGFVDDTSDGNRVYRAPAYFRSSEMKTAYFNPDAVFAQTKKGDATTLAYKSMTAIDFTDARFGTNDTYKVYDKGDVNVTFGTKTTKAFYPPLLDDDGLTGFQNVDLTANLLVYTMTGTTAADKTNGVVSAYLDDPKLSDYESNDKYRKVAVYDHWSNALRGHWVQLSGGAYKSTRDHLLIDKQDFNAPISYTFDSSHRMWYQREPNKDNFVDRTKGWDAVSLPFSAELVSTHQKGEITHFYSGSQESANGTGTKIGHEYWLREFDKTTAMSLKTGTTDIVEGNFKYPSGTESSSTAEVILKKDVMNTFLWDYYYLGLHDQEDMNKDTYQSYYSSPRSYTSYPMVTKGTPYIIGLPGPTYYEFDLSGVFKPTTTDTPNPLQLEKQTVTFASQKGATIGVSDDEMISVSNTYSGNTYTFKPSYLNESFAAGSDIYTLQSQFDSDKDTKADCSSFVKVPTTGDDTEVYAFRPYFMSKVGTGARPVTRAIVFNNDDSEMKGVEEKGDPDGDDLGKLKIYTRKHKIFVESALNRDIDIRILNAAGITISTFTLEPGETVETRIINAGVYIVQSADNRYIKKLAVK